MHYEEGHFRVSLSFVSPVGLFKLAPFSLCEEGLSP
jgi:hypothetical protein